MRKPKRLINKIYVVLSLFKKKGIMAKDGGWSANLSDLPKIHRYGVFFFTISLYLAKSIKTITYFFKKISHFLFFHRRKIYQGEVIYKIYEKRYFF